jgi:hypothetical protein
MADISDQSSNKRMQAKLAGITHEESQVTHRRRLDFSSGEATRRAKGPDAQAGRMTAHAVERQLMPETDNACSSSKSHPKCLEVQDGCRSGAAGKRTAAVICLANQIAEEDIEMNHQIILRPPPTEHGALDSALDQLQESKTNWARLPVPEKIGLLERLKVRIAAAAERWVEAASAAKGLPLGSSLRGEEWIAGPWALLYYLDPLKRRGAADCSPPREAAPVRELTQERLNDVLLKG